MKKGALLITLVLVAALGAGCAPRTTNKTFHASEAVVIKIPGLGDAPVDPNPGAKNGTLGVLNFASAARYYQGALRLSRYTATAFPSVLSAAQGALPIGNKATEVQAPAQMMALQQLANAACKDMLTGEAALAVGSRSFIGAISPNAGPAAVSQANLEAYFNQLSFAFVGSPANPTTIQILLDSFQEAAEAAPNVPSLAGNLSRQTLAALQIPCAALGSSPRAVKQ